MSKRDDRLAAESAEAKVARVRAIMLREYRAATPDPADSPDARAQRLSELLGLDSPLRRKTTAQEDEWRRHPGGKGMP